MQDYDATLKLLLRQSAPKAVRLLSGVTIEKWLDVELPKSQNLRMDLLGEDSDGNLHHLDLQSRNDGKMPLRMSEYKLGTYRLTEKWPRQTVLYVGEAPLSMPNELVGYEFFSRYRIIDARDLDGEELLASEDPGDNVIAILTRLRDYKVAVRAIVARIAELPESERHVAVRQLIVLAGLRRLEHTVKEELDKMPMTIDIMENQIIGPAIRQGIEQGLEQGREQGREEGERKLLRHLIEKRFGPLPDWANARLTSLSTTGIEALGERIFDARSLEDLFS